MLRYKLERAANQKAFVKQLWFGLAVAALVLFTACADGDTSADADVATSAGDTAVSSDMGADTTQAPIDGTEDATAPLPAKTTLTVQLVNAATGAPYAGVSVSAADQHATTDASGMASVMVPQGPYHVALDPPDARTHNLYGVAGAQDFVQTSYVSPDSITAGVFGSLGLTDDATRGIVVVGLDTPTLAPAVGASAALSSASDAPFIFAGFTPTLGSTIPATGQSFVTFPNVEAGPTTVTALFPEGSCAPYPAETGDPELVVHPGEVSINAYICR